MDNSLPEKNIRKPRARIIYLFLTAEFLTQIVVRTGVVKHIQ